MKAQSPIATLIQDLRSFLGKSSVLSESSALSKYEVDWRGRSLGKALAVVKPHNIKQVEDLLQWAQKQPVYLVPVGGQTGLCGGALPLTDEEGDLYPRNQAILVDLKNLNRLSSVDAIHGSIYVEAGVTLAQVQEIAQKNGFLFPVSLASEGSCTIGGTLATNAGGINVLHYGMMRSHCLALEVILPNGKRVWLGKGLHKDNTGYDLKQLLIGSEGTLGMIVGAILKLLPKPGTYQTALVCVENESNLIELFQSIRKSAGPLLTSFEIFSHRCVQLLANTNQLPLPQLSHHDISSWYAIIEYSIPPILISQETESGTENYLAKTLDSVSQKINFVDTYFAKHETDRQRLWQIRERIPLAQKQLGSNLKHDIALPISEIFPFLKAVRTRLKEACPKFEEVIFGHMGDGNLHYNLNQIPEKQKESIQCLVYETVLEHKGNLSAEHGIGFFRASQLAQYIDPSVLELMYQIKQAIDPEYLLNPGKVLK